MSLSRYYTPTFFTICKNYEDNKHKKISISFSPVTVCDRTSVLEQIKGIQDITKEIAEYCFDNLKDDLSETADIAQDKIKIFSALLGEIIYALNKLFYNPQSSKENFNNVELFHLFSNFKDIIEKYNTLDNRQILNTQRNHKMKTYSLVTETAFAIGTLAMGSLFLPLSIFATHVFNSVTEREGSIFSPNSIEYYDTYVNAYSNQLFINLKDEIDQKYLIFAAQVNEQDKRRALTI